MTFTWKQASYIKTPAQIAGEVCASLEEQGNLTAKSLLEISRDESAPLHKEFEWDDSVAAEYYREGQARHIINCLVITPDKQEAQTVRAFYNVATTGSEYKSINAIINTPTLYEQLLAQAKRDAEVFRDKYHKLHEVESIINAIDQSLDIKKSRCANADGKE